MAKDKQIPLLNGAPTEQIYLDEQKPAGRLSPLCQFEVKVHVRQTHFYSVTACTAEEAKRLVDAGEGERMDGGEYGGDSFKAVSASRMVKGA